MLDILFDSQVQNYLQRFRNLTLWTGLELKYYSASLFICFDSSSLILYKDWYVDCCSYCWSFLQQKECQLVSCSIQRSCDTMLPSICLSKNINNQFICYAYEISNFSIIIFKGSNLLVPAPLHQRYHVPRVNNQDQIKYKQSNEEHPQVYMLHQVARRCHHYRLRYHHRDHYRPNLLVRQMEVKLACESQGKRVYSWHAYPLSYRAEWCCD